MTPRSRFAEALVTLGTLTEEQLRECLSLASEGDDLSLIEAAVRLGYADGESMVRILAVAHGLSFIDLDDVDVPIAILELVPESIARENGVFPLSLDGRPLLVAVADPDDLDTLEKLRFVLNREIRLVVAEREKIRAAINRHYGLSETESVDSMLSEFTDTAIDRSAFEDDFDIPMSAAIEPEEPTVPVQRRANVRYYDRMNPARLFPLLVVLSSGRLAEVRKRHVSQETSEAFDVTLGEMVEVEPVLPGCVCYPPSELVRIGERDVTATFWVAPHVVGEVRGARVSVRRDQENLTVIPLEVSVRQKTLSLLLGLSGVLVPVVMVILKHFRLDFESQMDDGFPLFATVMGWTLRAVSPELLGAILLGLAAVAYLFLRPRKRDVFWEIRTEPGAR